MKFLPSLCAFALLLAGAASGFAQGQQFQIGSVATTNPGSGSNPNVFPSSGTENPSNAIDGTTAKYLNFGKLNTGYIFTLASSATAVANGITFTSANDGAERDPTTVSIYGSNNPSDAASTTAGMLYNLSDFSPIVLNLALPLAGASRNLALGNTLFSNSVAYSTYLVIFPTVANASAANSMQVGEADLTNTTGSTTTNVTSLAAGNVIGGGQVIPEPATAGLAFLASGFLIFRRRR